MFSFGSNKTRKGTKVLDNVYYFQESPNLDSNNYIISNESNDNLCLIDAGNGLSLSNLIEGMKELDMSHKNISTVILTHIHVDHLLGLYPLLNKLVDKPPQVYAFGQAAKTIKNADLSSIFPGNLGIGPEMFKVKIIPVEVNELKNDQELVLNAFKFRIMHTPGHSEGSICLYEPNFKILLCGDLVFTGGSFGRYDFPGGSLNKLKDSISKVNDLDVKYILPGHMGFSDNGNKEIERALNMINRIGPGGFFMF